MDIQRLRNLTTGMLHTDIGCVYKDLELITGEKGIMTHMIPRVCDAIRPWLEEKVRNGRFWNDKFDPTHIGEFDLPTPTEEERKAFWKSYQAMPNPLLNKKVIVVEM